MDLGAKSPLGADAGVSRSCARQLEIDRWSSGDTVVSRESPATKPKSSAASTRLRLIGKHMVLKRSWPDSFPIIVVIPR